MTKTYYRGFLLILIFTISSLFLSAQKWPADLFSIPLSRIANQPNQVFVSSGFTTVRPALFTLCGVQDFFSPPYAAQNFKLNFSFRINDQLLPDWGAWGGLYNGIIYARGNWYPGHIEREGMYNKRVNDTMIKVQMMSDLKPLSDKPGFILKVKVKNRGDFPIKIEPVPEVLPGNFGYRSLEDWGFSLPNMKDTAVQVSKDEWISKTSHLILIQGKKDKMTLLLPGSQAEFSFAVIVSPKDGRASESFDFEKAEKTQESAWPARLEKYLKNVPRIKSNIPELDNYYNRSVLSGMVCIWENPAFAFKPYLSSLGMDGGGFNCYLWDFGYSANMLALMLGEEMKPLIRQFTKIDLGKYYSFTPAGTGIGVSYSYSTYSFMNIVWAMTRHMNPEHLLIEDAKNLVGELEKKPMWNNLVDFGNQHNLLEMRTDGWEHFVASPNAERVWCLRRLCDLNDLLQGNKYSSEQWIVKADSIQNAIQTYLWDDKLGWFKSIYPDGHAEIVYSIQGYDPIQAGVCNETMTNKLLGHLKEGEFLFPYGVSSVSAADTMHFEFNDPDWGGSGAYTGDSPQLAMTMYGIGKPELGFNILERLFWMGHHLPYYPQEHYCERMAVPAHKRANTVSGLLGSEVILYGMVGLDPRIDGSLWLNPQLPENAVMSVTGYGWRGHNIDLYFDKGTSRVIFDGKQIYSGKKKQIRIK
jgi:hypothetical protein